MGLPPDAVDPAWVGHELPDKDSDEWLPVMRIAQRPWFQRLWIVQEFVLARDVVFYCGTRTVHWGHLFAIRVTFRDARTMSMKLLYDDKFK
ncbi:hypothetical protein Micbo1qcDRAFT_161532, partial [Microdochium bolleyi]